jgi:3-oxoacyl-[acyl-carrier-protein] synthase-3
MEPYLADPFRGARERRWLGEGERPSSLEEAAAREALDRAGLSPEDVDLAIVSSFFPDRWDTGNAAALARALGLRGGAWNLESACSGAHVAFQTACALVAAGRHRRVLCVTSCSYSRVTPATNPLSFGNGDGAAAFVVGEVPAGHGLLGAYARHTGETCGAVTLEPVVAADGGSTLQMRVDKTANRALRESAEPLLLECVRGALAEAGVSRDDVTFFVFNTPTAWYAPFCADALGIDASRATSVHSLYANVGPVLLPANLFHAAHEGRFGVGDLVLLYSVGSVSSAAASVVRWSPCALGRLPPRSRSPREREVVPSGG